MKKLLTLMIVVMMSAISFAQNDVTKFLGIPVDGTVAEMKAKLMAKGFKKLPYSDQLEGTFNGEDVFVSIVENQGKVWRIAVYDQNDRDVTNVRIRFNTLCSQFCKNTKYTALKKEEDYWIPEGEDISFELTVHNKRYEAAFSQQPTDTLTFKNLVYNALLLKYTPDQIYNPTHEQEEDMQNIINNSVVDAMEKRSVWFMIYNNYGKYRITMYYDNGYNRANGEDL